ncbi:DinB family protein [Metabacillus sp. RGM 3146]|uniref:DinB family protein n=1 Tax=Metabacillus sp. RGM 3146 TaxID=3401092 RepID=UPI003B9AD740
MFEHMKEVRGELLNEVESVSEEEFHQKPEEGQWSIGQLVDHLQKIENVMTETFKRIAPSAEDKKVEEKNLVAVTDRSYKKDAPDSVAPGEEPINREEVIMALTEARRDLMAYVDMLDYDLSAKSLKHPVMGELSVKQWVEFIGYHEERHLNQLREIKQAVLS